MDPGAEIRGFSGRGGTFCAVRAREAAWLGVVAEGRDADRALDLSHGAEDSGAIWFGASAGLLDAGAPDHHLAPLGVARGGTGKHRRVPLPASCELPLERAALAFARERHAGQRRTSDGADFMAHLDEVAGLLRAAGHGEATIAAGLLHDVLEKTDATRDELEARFGPRIAGLVAAMTENEAISAYEERKAEQRARVARHGPDALAVFAADKTAKVRELHDRVAGPEAGHKVDRRLGHYRACLDLLEAYAPDDALTRGLRVELRPFAGR